MKKVVIYFGTWSNYRPGNGKFEQTDINPHLCTHINYAFMGIEGNGSIKLLDSWLDSDLACIEKTIQLKQRNNNLKVLASVGGWQVESARFSSIAADVQRRANFISSTVALLLKYGFDGVDLDWEYPAQRGGGTADMQNYVILLQELKATLKAHNKLLTVAVAASEWSASQSYDIRSMSQHVDFINLMTYDFHDFAYKRLSHNASLPDTIAAVEFWLSRGAPAGKLVVGLPFYGRTFRLANSDQRTIGSPSSGPGNAGPYTKEAGNLGYNEICEEISTWHSEWDDAASVPYAFNRDQWLSYDDGRSIAKKVDYVNSRGLAGVMVWSIETDDFRGVNGEKFPLLNAIKRNLH